MKSERLGWKNETGGTKQPTKVTAPHAGAMGTCPVMQQLHEWGKGQRPCHPQPLKKYPALEKCVSKAFFGLYVCNHVRSASRLKGNKEQIPGIREPVHVCFQKYMLNS